MQRVTSACAKSHLEEVEQRKLQAAEASKNNREKKRARLTAAKESAEAVTQAIVSGEQSVAKAVRCQENQGCS
jgi:hypothetical protein